MRQGERGYVLVLVAATVAIAALALLSTAEVLSASSRALSPLRVSVVREIEMESVAARVSFLLLTEPVNGRAIVVGGDRQAGAGLNRIVSDLQEVRLDGRFYAAGAGIILSIQDEAGLLNLNRIDGVGLKGVLEEVDATSRDATVLAARLHDYVDEDGLTRVGGAEAAEYQRAGLRGPSNAALRAPWEASNVLGWRQSLSASQRAAFYELAGTPIGSAETNVNTAPIGVLTAILRDFRAAGELVARRERSPVIIAEDATLSAFTEGGGASLGEKVGHSFRVRMVWDRSGRESTEAYEAQAAFAGDGAVVPIYWRWSRRVPVPKRVVRSYAIESFPDGAALRPAEGRGD